MLLSEERESEIEELAARYGEPRRTAVVLSCTSLFDPLSKTDRMGEVCMVVRRLDGRLITARKTFYPPNAYRLLTGGIAHDEPIEKALLRETWEETGLDVEVCAFLAVIVYNLMSNGHPVNTERAFVTFVFLLDEVGGELQPQDEHEKIADFRCVFPDELPALAEYLDNLPPTHNLEFDGRLQDWGQFRAVVHRIVYESLHGSSQLIRW